MVCNCIQLPSAVADPTYSDCTFDFEGIEKHAVHFQELDVESFEPRLDWRPRVYRRESCQQRWYVECVPEEVLSPLFALSASQKMHRRRPRSRNTRIDFVCWLMMVMSRPDAECRDAATTS
jgi:hypothetical protein